MEIDLEKVTVLEHTPLIDSVLFPVFQKKKKNIFHYTQNLNIIFF